MRILSCPIWGASCGTAGKIALEFLDRDVNWQVMSTLGNEGYKDLVIIKNRGIDDSMVGIVGIDP
jgi:hypothetical protein